MVVSAVCKVFRSCADCRISCVRVSLIGVSMLFVSIDQTALPHSMKLCFAGAACDLRTNSLDLARSLEHLSVSSADPEVSGFGMRVVVDESSYETVGEPHFRGLHHVVTAFFGRSNVFVFDILRRTVSASVSATVARDDRFWKETLIPLTLGVLGCAMGLVPVHCACLESNGDGLLIAGPSGSGEVYAVCGACPRKASSMSRMIGLTYRCAATGSGPWYVGAAKALARCCDALSKLAAA